ncbi:MAG: 3-aminobutyryl-CoA ammonia lyase [Chloroflexi bacterium]|nr:3-aminobutyryl-CoA ammonia lyase [Chloroflexota bacterium]
MGAYLNEAIGGSQLKRQIKIGEWVSLRVRVSEKDVHYAGGLVNGAWVLGLFGDVATEVGIRHDGDEGLLAAYKELQLTAPVHAGEFIEARCKIVRAGNTSRELYLEAYKYIVPGNNAGHPSWADVLPEPQLVARGTMIQVVPKDCQRYTD